VFNQDTTISISEISIQDFMIKSFNNSTFIDKNSSSQINLVATTFAEDNMYPL